MCTVTNVSASTGLYDLPTTTIPLLQVPGTNKYQPLK